MSIIICSFATKNHVITPRGQPDTDGPTATQLGSPQQGWKGDAQEGCSQTVGLAHTKRRLSRALFLTA